MRIRVEYVFTRREQNCATRRRISGSRFERYTSTGEGNSLYEYRNNKWEDTGVERNINVSGWAWAINSSTSTMMETKTLRN